MQQQQLSERLFANHFNNKSALKQIADQYPYFGAVHFFLLQQSNLSDADYGSIAAKAGLHFNNAYLLNALLMDESILDNNAFEPIQNNSSLINKEVSQPQSSNKESKQTHEELLFEPLHASDYFASQGIKLSEEMHENDKLGKQLKSFTAWLKTMKKVNIERLSEQAGPVDHKVEQMAEKSNIEAKILTEAMAEVYISQGKIKKAIEIYQKLSLQNPSKSSFFANLIESLKDK